MKDYYINEKTGRTHIRTPAGGSGGGQTSFADAVASEAEHVAFLQTRIDAKKGELDALTHTHDEAQQKLEHKRVEAEHVAEVEADKAKLADDEKADPVVGTKTSV